MKKVRKGCIPIGVACAVVTVLLEGCVAISQTGGGSSKDTADVSADTDGVTADSTGAAESDEAGEGQVINLYGWNDGFKPYINDYYPEVDHVSDDTSITYLKDGTEIHWVVTPEDVYQQKLDEVLKNQENTEADEKVDLILLEADYVLKYIRAGVCKPLQELGITDEDLAQQYTYTQEIATDSDGVLRGSGTEATPGLFAYRRSIAKDVLGTDDPDKVQESLCDWEKFDTVAEMAKKKGYFMLSGYQDAYRVFSNNVSAPWVEGTVCTVDPSLMDWIAQTREYTEKGYNHKTSKLFSEDWMRDQGADAKVFGFFYSTWGINFTLQSNAGEEGFGDWAVCKGPQSYYWGGTWMAAANGTDNPKHCAELIKAVTCDKDIMKQISMDTQKFTNHQEAMNELAKDPSYGSDFLGGQNHIALFADVAPDIDMSNVSAYDQGCAIELQDAFVDYFEGKISLDKAKENFELAIRERYPELTEVVWP